MTAQLMQIALMCAPLIHPITMGAIISVESGGNPFAVSINYPQMLAAHGRDVPEIIAQPRSLAEATHLVDALVSQGFSTSLGLAQINTEHLEEFRLSYTQLFDPCINLRLAERILLRCKQQVEPSHSAAATHPQDSVLLQLGQRHARPAQRLRRVDPGGGSHARCFAMNP